MPVQNVPNFWLREGNLRLFLERVSARIGYSFADWDWDAIRFGVQETDGAQGHWYAYELSGKPAVALEFARSDNPERLYVRASAEAETAVRIDAIARILQCYSKIEGARELETLTEAAFITVPRPNRNKIVGCDARHLAICPECQEVLEFFGDCHWMTLLREEVPLPSPLGGSYAGLGFLTLEARRFFFPAYLVKALRDKDLDLLDLALEKMAPAVWTPLQQELIDFALYLLTGETF